MEQVGLILLTVAVLGFAFQCLKFVWVTLPENYGSNPGFGCFEMMVMPWFAGACIGVGLLMQSWIWGVTVFVVGIFTLGFFAMLLTALFGDR
ncbi:MAG: hypothetical protein ABUK11_00920 [Mariprofundaceae bacterium]